MPDSDPAPDQVKAALPGLAKHFDLLVIDTPPAAPDWLSSVMAAADLVLIPVRPSPHGAFGPADALGGCRLQDQERSGDLACGQTRDGPQGQGDC